MTARLKFLAILSAIWLIAIIVYAIDEASWISRFEAGSFAKIVLSGGIGPLIFIWGFVWIRAGRKENK